MSTPSVIAFVSGVAMVFYIIFGLNYLAKEGEKSKSDDEY